MIPRILHHVWLGLRPMHSLMVIWRQRWRKMNPDWRHLLWSQGAGIDEIVCDDDGFMAPELDFRSSHSDLLRRACHLSQRSNIWRYEIVHRFGGVYVDTDVEPLRPLDDRLASLDTFAVPRTGQPEFLETAFFGAAPGHPWTQDLCRSLDTVDPAASLSMGVHYFTKITTRHFESIPKVTLLPELAFASKYPSPDPRIGHRLGEVCLEPPADDGEMARRYPEAYAAHHWSSLWFPESFRLLEGEKGERR